MKLRTEERLQKILLWLIDNNHRFNEDTIDELVDLTRDQLICQHNYASVTESIGVTDEITSMIEDWLDKNPNQVTLKELVEATDCNRFYEIQIESNFCDRGIEDVGVITEEGKEQLLEFIAYTCQEYIVDRDLRAAAVRNFEALHNKYKELVEEPLSIYFEESRSSYSFYVTVFNWDTDQSVRVRFSDHQKLSGYHQHEGKPDFSVSLDVLAGSKETLVSRENSNTFEDWTPDRVSLDTDWSSAEEVIETAIEQVR